MGKRRGSNLPTSKPPPPPSFGTSLNRLSSAHARSVQPSAGACARCAWTWHKPLQLGRGERGRGGRGGGVGERGEGNRRGVQISKTLRGLGRAVGHGTHFCDTTKRASQRLTHRIRGEIPEDITEVGMNPLIPQPWGLGKTNRLGSEGCVSFTGNGCGGNSSPETCLGLRVSRVAHLTL